MMDIELTRVFRRKAAPGASIFEVFSVAVSLIPLIQETVLALFASAARYRVTFLPIWTLTFVLTKVFTAYFAQWTIYHGVAPRKTADSTHAVVGN